MKEQENFSSKYREYFKEDLEAVEEELRKSKGYSQIIDDEINKLSAPSLGSNKGSQHYLIEHIKNAVELQTQRQSLRRDRFNIKKTIIEYEIKELKENKSESSEAQELIDKLNQLLENDKKQKTEKPNYNENDLDDEIDKLLEEEDE